MNAKKLLEEMEDIRASYYKLDSEEVVLRLRDVAERIDKSSGMLFLTPLYQEATEIYNQLRERFQFSEFEDDIPRISRR